MCIRDRYQCIILWSLKGPLGEHTSCCCSAEWSVQPAEWCSSIYCCSLLLSPFLLPSCHPTEWIFALWCGGRRASVHPWLNCSFWDMPWWLPYEYNAGLSLEGDLILGKDTPTRFTADGTGNEFLQLSNNAHFMPHKLVSPPQRAAGSWLARCELSQFLPGTCSERIWWLTRGADVCRCSQYVFGVVLKQIVFLQ